MINKIYAAKKLKNEEINFSECIDKNNAQQDVTLFIRENELSKVQELVIEDWEE